MAQWGIISGSQQCPLAPSKNNPEQVSVQSVLADHIEIGWTWNSTNTLQQAYRRNWEFLLEVSQNTTQAATTGGFCGKGNGKCDHEKCDH
jgi:hypothetical protein